jgi:transcriptional regulator with XRE-family HTH domain
MIFVYRAICQAPWDTYYCLIGKRSELISIREILAKNMRENRRKCGISQAKLAEMANLSTQFVAMIELCRKFPSSETLERMASALGIEPHELFAVSPTPERALERLHEAVLTDIERVVGEAVERAVTEKCKNILPRL